MTNYDDPAIREILKKAFPPANTELRRDLWPAVLRRLDTRASIVPWYDWALIGLTAAAFLFSPQLILVLAYHL